MAATLVTLFMLVALFAWIGSYLSDSDGGYFLQIALYAFLLAILTLVAV